MKEISDKLHLECPSCYAFISVVTHEGPCEGIDFCVEDAPLKVLAEVNEESRKGNINCHSCGMDVALVVRFIAYEKQLSIKQRFNHEWRKV